MSTFVSEKAFFSSPDFITLLSYFHRFTPHPCDLCLSLTEASKPAGCPRIDGLSPTLSDDSPDQPLRADLQLSLGAENCRPRRDPPEGQDDEDEY
ncbi:uncharacterized protein V6R79_000349 [Siganus canaliculatus]